MISNHWLKILLQLLTVLNLVLAYDIYYTTPKDCTGNDFYVDSAIACKPCPENTTEPSSDRLSCVCKPGHRKVADYGGVDTRCTPCPEGQLPTDDGWSCIPCPIPRTANSTQLPSQCSACPNRNVLLVRNATGDILPSATCARCSASSSLEVDGSIQYCKPCNPSTNGGSCPCPPGSTGNEFSGGMCFAIGALEPLVESMFFVDYDNGEVVRSVYYEEHMRAAIYMCNSHKNFTACQLLANLCTLLHYSRNSEQLRRSDNACDHYYKIISSGGQPNEWPLWMPFLEYLSSDAPVILAKQDVDAVYSFDGRDSMSVLNFTAAVYSLNGTFMGLKPLTDGLLQLCPADQAVLDGAYKFGRIYRQTCRIKQSKLWNEPNLLFYDLYLMYPNRLQPEQLIMYPVPVLNYNFREDAQLVNDQSDPGRWKLFRRIFLIDNTIGREKSTAPIDVVDQSKSRYVRYAKSIDININFQPSRDGKIFPPLVRVRYAQLRLADYDPTKTVDISFQITYSAATDRHEKNLEITMATLCTFGTLWAMIRCWSWSRRSGKVAVDFACVIKFLVYLASTISNVFLIVLVCMCFWMLVLYKNQNTPILIMPLDNQEYSFLVYLSIALALKTIELIDLIVEQVTCTVFFVDWEHPRGYIIPRAAESVAQSGSVVQSGNSGNVLSPVTIWRTYMIANEWNELQNYRKTSYVLQLFAMVFFLKILTLENLAIIEPGATLWHAPTEYRDSRMSRFAVASVAYLVFGVFQWLINVLIIERCIVDHFRNFMDLCSVSNVSVMVLLYRRYGYYVHGRSVHGYADTNMKEMNEMLQREREGMCTLRGLEPNSEHQCFVACLPQKFREQYDKILSLRDLPLRMESRLTGADPTTTRMDAVIDIYTQMNKFFSSFLDHNIADVNFVVKERLFAESLLDIEFQDSSQKGAFYKDSAENAFTRVFIYGNEYTFLTFDMLIFCVTDLICHDFLIAALVTYLIASTVRHFRRLGGKKNLVRSGLIDERFLI